MSNKAIIGNIEARIDELRREPSLLQGALKVLGRKADGRTASGRRPRTVKNPVPPEGSFNLMREDVQKLLVKKPRAVNDLIAMLAEKKKVQLSPQAKRTMYARAYQHLLQLENSKVAQRTPDGWMRLG